MGFFLPSVILEELGVGDGVDMGMPRGSIGGFLEMGVVAGCVGGVGEVEVFRLVEGLIDGQGSLVPVDGGIDIFEPRES